MANTIAKVSGDVQTQFASTAVALPLVVSVKTPAGVPVASVTVTWAITVTPVGSTGQTVSSATVDTDANGLSQVTLTLGTGIGTYAVTATAAGLTGSPILFYAYGVTNSRLELALAQILAEFRLIDVGSGYRTTPHQVIGSIRPYDQIQSFPEIGVELGDETLIPKDDAWTLFDQYVPVIVVGTVKCDTDVTDDATHLQLAVESLSHDMKKVVATIIKKYIVLSNPWNIMPNKEIKFVRVQGYGDKRNIGFVGVEFMIKIRNLDGSFDD